MSKFIFSEDSFKDKNIIISGGAGDIGLEIAKEFAKSGAKRIALLDNNTENLNKSAALLNQQGAVPVDIEVDLLSEKSIQAAVTEIYRRHDQWDILITAAGMFIGGTLTDYKTEDWDTLMNINARSVFILSKLVAENMIKSGHGKIIHIGSGSTYYGTPGSGGYSASKVVINQLTQTMAVEWGPHNIQVNTICPTVTETKFLKFVAGDSLHEKFREKLKEKIPLKRLLQPSDIAPAVLFLASEGSQFINGAIIPIDGGSRLVST